VAQYHGRPVAKASEAGVSRRRRYQYVFFGLSTLMQRESAACGGCIFGSAWLLRAAEAAPTIKR